ncbi:helix-turn-helix domain-containing protein [Salinimicrobium oceani]|uniref:Helix-turn-helix domain-containing protein n=1 Tax=Salinimicrobium oceani TaxID=2722702 RepID=A0ABX1CZ09_9FLAO|nr:helix-turn-helix domain-containing protein [Salinimicrobium oceani]NJW51551.1 helix-turn-helix domain-containing protein [Salinimicrobium oceani]
MPKPETYLPAPALQEYIASYGVIEIPEGEFHPYFSPPLALSGFIINVGSNHGKVSCKIDGRDFFTESAVATGQVTSPVYGEMRGEVKSILVFFKPTGMHRLFGNDLSELTNDSKILGEIVGNEEADLLWERLISQPGKAEQIEILDEFFSKRIKAEPQQDHFESILDYIHNKNGNVSISEIEQNTGFSRKTLERHFRKKVGLTPKVYSQIYQFKCLLNFLETHPEITWTQLANQTGYFDQSHMSRYVKEYLQVSPNSMVKLDMDFINYLLNR